MRARIRHIEAPVERREPPAAPAPRVDEPPAGWARIAWLGPGFLWMVSAAGSGELLFTPRIGALYGYALVWALVAAVTLKWFINREIGRYTVCSGNTVIEGFRAIPGPRNWALWLILVPQLVVAVSTIAGLAGSAATALILMFPGDVRIWTVVSILAAAALVVWGRFNAIQLVASALAIALAVTAVAAALSVGPDVGGIGGGLVPQTPEDVDYGEVLPWLGFMLSGAAGMIWYSHWIHAKGYAAAPARLGDDPDSAQRATSEERSRLQGWLKQMTLDNSVAVVGTLIITLAFLVLGAELLRPEGLVPEEDRIAEVLGELLGGVWGRFGFWFMVLAVFVGFWDTVLSDQDGFGRMFSNGTHQLSRWSRRFDQITLLRVYVIVLLTVIPIALYLVIGEPVTLLKTAGAIEAAHIPVVAALVLFMNARRLPAGLRPSPAVAIATSLAALFFAGFAIFYVITLI